MTLIKVSSQEWVLVDGDARIEGTEQMVSDALTFRLSKLLALFEYTGGEQALRSAQGEVDFALECMRREGHNMADFGVGGHFIRTLDPSEVRLAS